MLRWSRGGQWVEEISEKEDVRASGRRGVIAHSSKGYRWFQARNTNTQIISIKYIIHHIAAITTQR